MGVDKSVSAQCMVGHWIEQRTEQSNQLPTKVARPDSRNTHECE